MTSRKQQLLHIGGGLFIAFVIYVIYSADHGSLPRSLSLLYGFPGGDKAGHVAMFALLSFFVNILLYPRTIRLRTQTFQTGTMLVLFLITLEESSQQFIATRTFDLVDLGCSYLGIFIGGVGCKQMVKRSTNNRRP